MKKLFVLMVVLVMAGCAGHTVYAGKACDNSGKVMVCVQWSDGTMICTTQDNTSYRLKPWETEVK